MDQVMKSYGFNIYSSKTFQYIQDIQNIYKYKENKNPKTTKLTNINKIIKYELWNLYLERERVEIEHWDQQLNVECVDHKTTFPYTH